MLSYQKQGRQQKATYLLSHIMSAKEKLKGVVLYASQINASPVHAQFALRVNAPLAKHVIARHAVHVNVHGRNRAVEDAVTQKTDYLLKIER